MTRASRFFKEYQLQRLVGWSRRSAVRHAWRRSHPNAAARTRKWISEICDDGSAK